MRAKTIVILGAGVGGLITAAELQRRLPGGHRVVVVEQSTTHAFAPSFTWVMNGFRRPEQVTRPVRQLMHGGAELVQAKVLGVDPAKRQVATDGPTLSYDYLVIALGSELDGERLPGLAEAAHTFYSLEGARRLREALPGFAGGRIAVVICRSPYKCPGAPHEGAMLLDAYFRQRGMRDRVDLQIYSCEPQPMPDTGPQMGQALLHLLGERDISFHPLHRLVAVDAERGELRFEGKTSVPYDLLIAVPPHCGPSLLRETGLAAESGWVTVDRTTLATGLEGVYAIGDATAVLTPGRWAPERPLFLPKGGVFAHGQGLVVARRIAADLAGRDGHATFNGHGFCVVDTGRRRAVAATADFFAEPTPQIRLHATARAWHCGKVLFERWWLTPPGLRRSLLRMVLSVGCGRLGLEM